MVATSHDRRLAVVVPSAAPGPRCPAVALEDAAKALRSAVGAHLASTGRPKIGYFSTLYEITASTGRQYVVKVNEPTRSSSWEFEMYAYLKSLGIPTLTPVLTSEQFNYLVTEKRELTPLPDTLQRADRPTWQRRMRELGALVRELSRRTAASGRFNGQAFDDRLLSRVARLRCLDAPEKSRVERRVRALSAALHGRRVTTTLATDLNLGNVHVGESGDLVLVDLADAHREHYCANLATVYASLRFGPLQRRLERRERTSRLFGAFLCGYAPQSYEQPPLDLFIIERLVQALAFLEALPPRRLPVIGDLPSRLTTALDLFRYRRALTALLARTDAPDQVPPPLALSR